MDDATKKVIAGLEDKLEKAIRETNEIKTTINMLLKQGGETPKYTIEGATDNDATMRISGNRFHGKPLATSFKEFLTLKGEAASVDDIHAALIKGGHAISGKTDAIQKRNLKIAMIKSPDLDYIKGNNTFWFKPDNERKAANRAKQLNIEAQKVAQKKAKKKREKKPEAAPKAEKAE